MAIPQSSRLISSAITNQAFANLYNLINNRSNTPDPIDGTGTRKFVYSSRIPHLGRNYGNQIRFPFIVVSRTKLRKGKVMVSLERKFHDFSFFIYVYSRDNDSDASGNPNGAEQCSQITDSIVSTLDNPTNKKTLISQGMANMVYDTEPDEDELDGKTVFITEFDIRFENNLTSAQ